SWSAGGIGRGPAGGESNLRLAFWSAGHGPDRHRDRDTLAGLGRGNRRISSGATSVTRRSDGSSQERVGETAHDVVVGLVNSCGDRVQVSAERRSAFF